MWTESKTCIDRTCIGRTLSAVVSIFIQLALATSSTAAPAPAGEKQRPAAFSKTYGNTDDSTQFSEATEPSDEETIDSSEPTYPGLITHVFPVADTDPNLAAVDKRSHWAYFQPGTKARGQLLLYMPGTHGTGKKAHAFNSLAAQLGYHVLSLTYRTETAMAVFRKSSDPDAFQKGRDNVLYGAAPIGPLKVDESNSALNRLVKALIYLNKTYPREGWGAYLNGGEPVWSKFVIAGTSQGGGNACYMGLQHHVARVIMFGAPKDNSLYFKQPAKWFSLPSKTPLANFFCFTHSLDEGHGCTYKQQISNYKALGLYPRYPIIDVDDNAPPYNHTRLLTSHKPAAEPKLNHAIVSKDFKSYTPPWKYLLTEACP